MKHISEIINEILVEWAYRVNDGMPDPKNPMHMFQLKNSLNEMRFPAKFTETLLQNLRELEFTDQEDFNKYNKKHKMRPTTKVTIGDKETEVGKHLDQMDGDDEESMDDLFGQMDDEEYGDIEALADKNKEILDKISQEKNPKKKEALKAEYIDNQLDNMLKVSNREVGGGRYDLSNEDIKAYRKYQQKIMADPENEPEKMLNAIKEEQRKKYGEITEEDIDNFIEDLIRSSKSGSEKSDMYDPSIVTDIKTKIKGKGGVGSTYTTGERGQERFRNVIKAYLETGGISPITGEVVPFSEAQLDHIVSLGNGGKDEPDNWMFMEERFNQYKGKKTDEDVRANLERDFHQTDAEISAGAESTKVLNALKDEDRAFWKTKFEKVKGSDNPRDIGLTKNQIEKMTKPQLANVIYGFNLANPDSQLSRYETQKIDVDGRRLDYARGEGEDNPVKPVKGDPSTYGLVVNDDGKLVKKYPNDTEEESLKRFNDNRPSGGREKSTPQFIEMMMEEGLASDSTEIDEAFMNEINNHRTGQNKRSKAIKDKVKAAKDAPGSMENKKKIVIKAVKEWQSQNPEPSKDLPSKKRQKSKEWQDWKKNKDIFIYKQWSQFSEKENK